MGRSVSKLVLCAVLALAVPPIETSAAVETCSPTAVSARGEPSAFNWLARTKARANWRAKVRQLKGLGAPYSDWNRAHEPTEDCGPDGRGIACTFSGIPCRP